MRHPRPLATLALSLLALRASAVNVFAPTNKPALTPPGGMPELLKAHFPPKLATFTKWGPNEVPKDCVDIAQMEKKEPDFEVYDVKYEDCATPWVLCHHKGRQIAFDDAATHFGRIPIGARQFVRHFVLFDAPTGIGPSGFPHESSIVIRGRLSLAGVFHEVGHILDLGKTFGGGQLSASEEWKNAIDRDGYVSDNYAAKNLIESLAQDFVIAALDLTIPGGYASIQPEWRKLENQMGLLRAKLGNLLAPGQGSCDRKVPLREVDFNKAKQKLRRGVRARAEKPDTSLGGGLNVIPSMEFDTEMFGTGNKQ
ncbi:MAG: hypothetical protein L6R35_006244 [Caloplaca aegaea]|nr:MAG: hypothetical protein L6R35_006244 [Caloplaca aegaea]